MKSYCILKLAKLDDLLLLADQTHLLGIYFAHEPHVPPGRDKWALDPEHPILKRASEQLREYLEGKRKTFTLPLSSEGTEFQREVWRQIALIPFGETITYGELAARTGAPQAIRAAGTATGKNPLSIVVPCHRVVGKGGGLGGYAGGLERKRRLLEIELGTPDFQLVKK